MEKYLELTEGTIIETRNYSLIWRYAGMILNEIGEIQVTNFIILFKVKNKRQKL